MLSFVSALSTSRRPAGDEHVGGVEQTEYLVAAEMEPRARAPNR